MTIAALTAIIAGYLLGSIPSAYLIGRWLGKTDLRQEGDGHVSATAVYRTMGLLPLILVVIMDGGKAILAVYAASKLTTSSLVLLATACATLAGHCWPVYIRFKGGLGATVIYLMLLWLAWLEFLIAGLCTAIFLLIKRKASLATYVFLASMSLALLIIRQDITIAVLPLCLLIIHLIKRFQIQKSGSLSNYRNELFDDLKRQK
jgi:glycerol-3-phosphate acyltransferase PlsY